MWEGERHWHSFGNITKFIKLIKIINFDFEKLSMLFDKILDLSFYADICSHLIKTTINKVQFEIGMGGLNGGGGWGLAIMTSQTDRQI